MQPSLLKIDWVNDDQSIADLTGWIATGGDLLSPLLSPKVWSTATITDYGATVEWSGQNTEIDAYHLYQIAESTS